MKLVRRIAVLSIPVAVLFATGPAFAGEHAFVGSNKCKACHIKEWKSWAETKMAKSFDVLKAGERAEAKKAAGLDPAKDYTKDATCVPCHTTGYGEKGGFVDFASTPKLVGVGCESCHGAGGTYIKPEHMSLKNKEYKKADIVAVGLVDKVGPAQCTSCHNSESPFVGPDYKFDFEAKKSEGAHETYPLKYEH